MMSATVINLPGFVMRMQARKTGLELQAERFERALAEEVAFVAKDLVTVDTGETRDNIRAEKRGDEWFVVSDRGGKSGDVAVFLELGTRYMAARPYMVPAADLVVAANGIKRVERGIGGLLIR